MTLYKTKNVQVAAVQWTGGNLEEITRFAGEDRVNYARGILQVKVTDGRWLSTVPGWWVVTENGQLLALQSDRVFDALYERVE